MRRDEIDERTGRKVLENIRAWRIAVKLNWRDAYRAEYIALTQLQADALATANRTLAATIAGSPANEDVPMC